MKQYEAVIETLERLGGIATLGKLNQEVFKIKDCAWKTKTPFASIRRIVQDRKEIYKIKPGLWALVSHRKQLEERGITADDNKASSPNAEEFNHTYYQGLLVEIGNIKHLKTYVPEQDKNKLYINTPLKEIRSLGAIPPYSYPDLVHRSSTVDVIWFNERIMPACFFEVEHSTDIQNSLLKFCDLQDFYAKMVIVADEKRKEEYEKKYGNPAFASLHKNKRVSFLDYASLHKWYDRTLEEQEYPIVL